MKKVVEDVGEDEDFKSGAWVSATDYMNANGGTVIGCLGDIKKFLKNGKLDQVVAIVKSCSLNAIGDLRVTMKDLSVFSPKPSMHYLNITMRNVVKVFRKDTIPCSGYWKNRTDFDFMVQLTNILESIDPSKQIAIIEHYLYILGHLESIDPSICISWKLSSSALEMLVPGHAVGNVMGRGRANVIIGMVMVTAAGGIVFEMEDCSWLYGVYEETAGVINMGLMMVRLMFIDCGSDIDSCSDEDV
ncbi:GPCR kinase [Tanacetum coccineum]|uniref:GPCR kinase n=1 Tax=Tanacetum coccineum TaxID=301880 RepID=A0ABQ5HIH4_9ASTR